MKPKWIVDTGPLIALLDRRDQYHDWACKQFEDKLPPLLTCEAVLTEACFLATRAGLPTSVPIDLINRRALQIAFAAAEHTAGVRALMERYQDLPMSFADACLVCMSELIPGSVIMTLDSHFRIYRGDRRRRIPICLPPDH